MQEDQAQALIARAGTLWNEPASAEALLLEARRLAPHSIDVLIALYRFYFYRSDLTKALAVAENCLASNAGEIGVAADWRVLESDGRDFADLDSPPHRLHLFALKAYGYLLLRLGRGEEGEAVLAKVRALDPGDRVGSGVLQQVMAVRRNPDPDE
jgi:hypothetical protein